jgi:hypothetical protein
VGTGPAEARSPVSSASLRRRGEDDQPPVVPSPLGYFLLLPSAEDCRWRQEIAEGGATVIRVSILAHDAPAEIDCRASTTRAPEFVPRPLG